MRDERFSKNCQSNGAGRGSKSTRSDTHHGLLHVKKHKTKEADVAKYSSVQTFRPKSRRKVAKDSCCDRPPMATVDEVPNSICPKKFWKDYISKRKPAVIDGHPTDSEWLISKLWSVQYLVDKVGQEPVTVEHRKSNKEAFGLGNKQVMEFGDVLKRLHAGDSSLYLTTQDQVPGPDGHPEIFSSPVSLLLNDFPLSPSIFGSLVPQQINFWAGCAHEGATSGLHHDFHDNLYVLLKGRKRFRIYPPHLIENMYTEGDPIQLYSNGRIIYEGQEDVNADGSSKSDVKAWKARKSVEQAVKVTEVQGMEFAGQQSRRDGAEDDVDAALENLLDAALDDDFEGFLDDDYDAMDSCTSAIEATDDHDVLKNPGNTNSAPPSFSKINVLDSAKVLKNKFPRFPGLDSAIEVIVEAGQCLYLPAGWFHEVTSFSCKDAVDGQVVNSNMHMAFNYWFWPPDNLDSTEYGFMKPYKCGYWPELWSRRLQRYSKMKNMSQSKNGFRQGLSIQNCSSNNNVSSIVEKEVKVDNKHTSPADTDNLLDRDCRMKGLPRWPCRSRSRSNKKVRILCDAIHKTFGLGRRQHLRCFVRTQIKKLRRL